MFCPNYYTNIYPSPQRNNIEELNCIGFNLSLDQWKGYWLNIGNTHTSCTDVFKRKLVDVNNNFSPSGFQETVEDFNFMFNSYFNTNYNNGKGQHIIGVPGQKGYDNFSTTLISACSNNAQYGLEGVCQQVATNMCSSCTYEDITNNKDLLKLCGCEVSSLPDLPEYKDISKSCQPTCSHEQVSKQRSYITGVIDECKSAVCVINNININVSKSIVGGTNFIQVCPQCNNGEVCKCIIDASIPTIGEQVGIANNFTQYCGNNSICTEIDNTTGVSKIVDCKNTIDNLKPEEYKIIIPGWVWIICFVIMLIFVLVIFSAIHVSFKIENKIISSSKKNV